MLFNSYLFLLVFLPSVLLGFYLLRGHAQTVTLFIQVASVIFYSYWSARSVFILAASVLFNFTIGRCIIAAQDHNRRGVAWIYIGIGGDFLLLGYFKYA